MDETLEAWKIGGIMVIAALVLGALIVKIVCAAADYWADDSDIKLAHSPGTRWRYTFQDPYEVMISKAGFYTRYGAWRAAQRKRNNIARELGNMCGLL